MEPTIDSLIKSYNLPLSIVIVGIGEENFENMLILDGDQGLFNTRGEKA